ncbi:MAG: hypothetical protein KIB00_16905 [Paeniclostridium sordellii]|nr:hypothetical protein [Paeniclostridium sordellii]
MQNISRTFEFTIDISKTEKENRKAIPKIELYTIDVDTNSFIVSAENKGIPIDLMGLEVRADVVDNQGDEVSQSDGRIRVEGNKIHHLVNTELMNEEGTCYINYVLTNLETREQKVLTKFQYEVVEAVYSMNESKNRNEVLAKLQKDVSTKVDEVRVKEIVVEQVEGGVELDGYAKVDHTHDDIYVRKYVNPPIETQFEECALIVRDVEVGGTK